MTFSDIFNLLKSNKLASLAGTFTAIGLIVSGMWAVDARYAKAADVGKVERSLEAQNIQVQIQLNKQSIRSWQDKIDDVDDKSKPTEDDLKKKRRWERQVEELKLENKTLQEEMIQLKR